MKSISSILVAALASMAFAKPDESYKGSMSSCLTDDEAQNIATSWLNVFTYPPTGTLQDAAKVISKDIEYSDQNFGPNLYGIKDIYTDATEPDETVSSYNYIPIHTFHDCYQIATRWSGCATPSNKTNTTAEIQWYGTDILVVDLETRLISYANSSGDWIVVAQKLGETVVV